MRAPLRRSRRGVTLIEGLISTVILLIGMVGVLQGLGVATVQNSMANRHTRASIIAQELITAIEQQGRARALTSGSGLFATPACNTSFTTLGNFRGDLAGSAGELPPHLVSQGFTACDIDFDAQSGFQTMTPGYTATDRTLYERMVAVYRHPTNNEILYVGVNVGWRDGGRVRIVKRFTAIYDTTTNQTNLEF